MELFQLRYFLAVASHLSFTRAARALNLSQPPLSLQIRRLEDELGGPLFVRDSHSVRLSDLGEVFLPYARQILDQVTTATEELGSRMRLEKGVLRIGASGPLATYLLPLLLERFRERHPGVEVQIVERRTAELLELAESDAIDLALIRLPHDRTRLDTHVVGSEPLVATLPPSHRLASRSSVPLSELAQEPIILIARRGEPFHRQVLELCGRHGFQPNIICYGAGHTTACRLVGLGMGVSILSAMTRHLIVDPMPVFVPFAEEDAKSPIALLSNSRSKLAAPARAFFDIVSAVDLSTMLVCRVGQVPRRFPRPARGSVARREIALGRDEL